jgi:hypothetical protein
MQVLSNTAVMSLHLPVVIPLMKDKVRSVMAKQEDVLWYYEARWITFCVALKAVVGELLTMEVAEQIFPLFKTMASGGLALVCPRCLHAVFRWCAQSVFSMIRTGAPNLSLGFL